MLLPRCPFVNAELLRSSQCRMGSEHSAGEKNIKRKITPQDAPENHATRTSAQMLDCVTCRDARALTAATLDCSSDHLLRDYSQT